MKNLFKIRFGIQWNIAIFLISASLFSGITTQAFAQESGQSTYKSSTALNSTQAKKESPEHPVNTVNSTVQKNSETRAANIQDTPHSPKRELSAFFKVGIAINIAMIITFAYWFVGQWRQQK